MGIFRETNAPDRFPPKLFLADNTFRPNRTVRKTSHIGFVQPTPNIPNYSIELGEWISWALNNNVIFWDTSTFQNIYNASLSLEGDRIVTHAGFDLLFDTSDDTKFAAGGNNTFIEINAATEVVRIGDINNVTGDSNGIYIDNANGIVSLGDVTDDGIPTVGLQSEVSTGYLTDYGIRRFIDYGLGNNSAVNLSKIQSSYAPIFATDGTILEVDISTIAGDSDQNLWLQFVADSGSVSANTTTDTFTITGGTGIATAISGDEIIITNTDPNTNITHIGEVTGLTTLTAHESIISNKTEVTPVTGDYLLLWDATDTSLKKINYSNIIAGNQNLWLNFAADVGSPVAANTTTDTFTYVGGTGIETEIVGDTVVITNTDVGATYTASNGILLSTADFQLGGTSAGGGDWDFTATRYLYTDTFNFVLESASGYFGRLDATNSYWAIGGDFEPKIPVHIWASGDPDFDVAGDFSGDATMLILQNSGSAGNDVSLALLGGGGTGSLATLFFATGSDYNEGYIRYDYEDHSMIFATNETTGVSTLDSDGKWNWNIYGVGSVLGTMTYLIGVTAGGDIIEVDPATFDVGDTTIYDRDGILTGNRVLDNSANNYSLTFNFTGTYTSSQIWSDTQFTRAIADGPTSLATEIFTQGEYTLLVMESTGHLYSQSFTGASGLIGTSLATGGITQQLLLDFDDVMLFDQHNSDTSQRAQLTLGYGNQASLLLNNTNHDLEVGIYDAGGGDSEIRLVSPGVVNASVLNGYVWTLTDDTTGAGEWTAAGGSIQNLWLTIVGDTGSTVANTPTDALEILGGTDIETVVSGDTLTINYTGSGGSAVNIYTDNGSIDTGESRILSGTANENLTFNFVQGGTSSSQTWEYNELLRDVSISGGNSIEESLAASIFSRVASNSAGTNTTSINQSSTVFNISKTHDTLYNHFLTFTAGSAFFIVDSLVTGFESKIELHATASAQMTLENSGNIGQFSIINVGTEAETRIFTKAIDNATAANGYVYTLVDSANGHGEWMPGASSQNLWETIIADSGTTTANTPTDSLTIIGGTDIETSISGDTLTINWTGASGVDTNIYLNNGSLVSDRTLSMSTFDLTFDGLTSANFLTKWDNTNNRWYTYSIQGGQYLALKTSNSAEIGAWTSTLDSTTNNKLTADSAGIGLYRNVAGSTTEYIKIFDSGSGANQGYIELSSNNSGFISTVNIDGPVTTITGNGAGSSYSKVTVTGSAIAGSNTIDLTVYDGGSDTNSLIMNDVETTATSAWADTGIKTDPTARSADHHNYSPTDLDKTRIIRYNSTGFHYLTGIDAGHTQGGTIIEIWNIGTSAFNIANESSSSSTLNRVITPLAMDFRVSPGGACVIRYDDISQRWRIIAPF